MGWNPVKEAEKKAKQAVDKILKPAEKACEDAIWKLRKETWAKIEKKGKDTIDSVENSAKKLGGEIEGGIKDIGHEIEDNVKSVGRDMEEKLHRVGDEIEETVEERIPDLIETAIEELSKAISAEGFTKARDAVRTAKSEMDKLAENKPKLVSAIDELGFTLKIGPVGLSYGSFYSRSGELLEVLNNLASKPPSFRRKPIIGTIEALGPDHIDLGIDIQLAAFVVSSDALEVGFSLDAIPLALFTEIGDIILEEIGIPE